MYICTTPLSCAFLTPRVPFLGPVQAFLNVIKVRELMSVGLYFLALLLPFLSYLLKIMHSWVTQYKMWLHFKIVICEWTCTPIMLFDKYLFVTFTFSCPQSHYSLFIFFYTASPSGTIHHITTTHHTHPAIWCPWSPPTIKHGLEILVRWRWLWWGFLDQVQKKAFASGKDENNFYHFIHNTERQHAIPCEVQTLRTTASAMSPRIWRDPILHPWTAIQTSITYEKSNIWLSVWIIESTAQCNIFSQQGGLRGPNSAYVINTKILLSIALHCFAGGSAYDITKPKLKFCISTEVIATLVLLCLVIFCKFLNKCQCPMNLTC